MPEALSIGTTTCDYLRTAEFLDLCARELAAEGLYHVVTLNPEMVMLAQSDMSFREALQQASIRVPDGSGLIWARWYLRSIFWSLLPSLLAFPFVTVERVSGVDALTAIARLAEAESKSVYLLGGTARQNSLTAKKLQHMFPKLRITSAPPHVYSESGPTDIITDINRQAPDVLLVAYGAPKQTIWLDRHGAKIPSVRLAVGVGGAFAILSEDRPRAPKLLQRLNLEWLWRLLLEPRRFRRIWRATVEFPRLIQKQRAANPPVFTT